MQTHGIRKNKKKLTDIPRWRTVSHSCRFLQHQTTKTARTQAAACRFTNGAPVPRTGRFVRFALRSANGVRTIAVPAVLSLSLAGANLKMCVPLSRNTACRSGSWTPGSAYGMFGSAGPPILRDHNIIFSRSRWKYEKPSPHPNSTPIHGLPVFPALNSRLPWRHLTFSGSTSIKLFIIFGTVFINNTLICWIENRCHHIEF